jgi:hypothetical protein
MCEEMTEDADEVSRGAEENGHRYGPSAFESFLLRHGLECRRRIGPDAQPFGNTLVEYADSHLGVQVVSDRGLYSVSISDQTQKPIDWYDVDLMRKLLGLPESPRMMLYEQTDFVEKNWAAIRSLFDSSHAHATESRLRALRIAGFKKQFPGFTGSASACQLEGQKEDTIEPENDVHEHHQKTWRSLCGDHNGPFSSQLIIWSDQEHT